MTLHRHGRSNPELTRTRTAQTAASVAQAQGIPVTLGIPAAIGAAFLILPLLAVIWRAPWSSLPQLIGSPTVRDALGLSLACASVAMLISLLLGVPLAWYLANSPGRLAAPVRGLVTVPLVLPPVVGGIALLMALGRTGIVGQWLATVAGVTLPFSTAGVIVAETFVAMPFLVVTVEGALRSSDGRYAEAARTLGATRLTVFRRVSLPLILPALASGAALTWARALGEFGATITFAGNFPGRTQTMPLAAYLALQTDPEAAIALSLVLLTVSVLILWALRGRWRGHSTP
ncbi:MAG: ABC transporter permease [Nostocoides sp.]